MKEFSIAQVHPDQHEYIGEAVSLINEYSQDGLMLPVTTDHYHHLAQKGRLFVAVSEERVIGTVAYSQQWGDHLELGGWAVAEDWRVSGQKGVGLALLTALLITAEEQPVIAFGNDNSGPIFERLGAVVMSPTDIPSEALGLCATCPSQPEAGCCDSVFDLSPVILNMITNQAGDL